MHPLLRWHLPVPSLLLRRHLPVALLLWRRLRLRLRLLHLALPLRRHLPIALRRRPAHAPRWHAWLHPLLRRHLPVALLLRLLRPLRGILLDGLHLLRLLRLLRGILLHLPIPSLLLRRL